jgi:ribosomal protein S6--L-glutamate ligase
MILSFHPLFEADINITCAGRPPAKADLEAIQNADAVVLAQGCSRGLYEMARENCRHVFPNYDARFQYPEKIGQMKLLQSLGVPVPRTKCFQNGEAFHQNFDSRQAGQIFGYPLVFKFNWGGEGDTVFLIESGDDLAQLLEKASCFEKSGQSGFMLQKYISFSRRCLRVAIIGEHASAYWRIQPDPLKFGTSISRGGYVDRQSDPALMQKGIQMAKTICDKTDINLAGFDFLVDEKNPAEEILCLEINYFFGRRGLGGSETFYEILLHQIHQWIEKTGLSMKTIPSQRMS